MYHHIIGDVRFLNQAQMAAQWLLFRLGTDFAP